MTDPVQQARDALDDYLHPVPPRVLRALLAHVRKLEEERAGLNDALNSACNTALALEHALQALLARVDSGKVS